MKDYTFGQAKRMLSRTAYLHGKAPVGEQINDAVIRAYVDMLRQCGAWPDAFDPLP